MCSATEYLFHSPVVKSCLVFIVHARPVYTNSHETVVHTFLVLNANVLRCLPTAEKLTREANALAALMTSRGRGGRRRGRGRARGGRSPRGRVITAAPLPQITTPAVPPPAPIVIESDASDVDSASGSSEDYHRYTNTSDDSQDSVEGVPGTYFGGWGHCFHCGT